MDSKADAAAAALSITAERAALFDFSQPTLSGGLQIMVPAGGTERSSPGLVDFLKLLFSKVVLVWLAAAFVGPSFRAPDLADRTPGTPTPRCPRSTSRASSGGRLRPGHAGRPAR